MIKAAAWGKRKKESKGEGGMNKARGNSSEIHEMLLHEFKRKERGLEKKARKANSKKEK